MNKEIKEALQTQLDAMATDLSVSVSWFNVSFNPEGKEVYIAENFLPVDTEASSINANCTNFERLIYQLSIFQVANKGDKLTRDVIAKVQEYFSRGTILTSNGINVRITKIVENTAQQSTDWLATPISIYCYSETPN